MLWGVFICANLNGFSQVKSGKTILDYYLMLPDEYLGCKEKVIYTPSIIQERSREDISALKANIIYSNLKKGYLKTSSRTIVLFKDHEHGEDVIVIGNNPELDSCPDIGITLLTPGTKEKYWHQRSDILPPEYIISSDRYFQLPENGTTISVFQSPYQEEKQKDAISHYLVWKNGYFNVVLKSGLSPPENKKSLVDHYLLPENPSLETDGLIYDYFYQLFNVGGKHFAAIFCRPPCETESCSDEYNFYQWDNQLEAWINITEDIFSVKKITQQLIDDQYRLENNACSFCEGFRFSVSDETSSQLQVFLTIHDNKQAQKLTYGGVFEIKDDQFILVKSLE